MHSSSGTAGRVVCATFRSISRRCVCVCVCVCVCLHAYVCEEEVFHCCNINCQYLKFLWDHFFSFLI